MLSRRLFLLAAASAPAGVAYYTFHVEPWLEVVRRSLPVRGLPPELVARLWCR